MRCRRSIDADRAETDPKIFTKIHLVYRITGQYGNLSRDKVERAVMTLSNEKYCSATAMLGAVAKISHEIELVEAET